MKKIIFCLSSIAFLFSSVIFADVQTGSAKTPIINLVDRVVVAPTQTYKLSMQKLAQNGIYNVYCTIVDGNNSANKAILAFSADGVSGANGDYYLNGQSIGPIVLNIQYTLPQANNSFKATKIYQWNNSLNFTNLDQTDSVELDNCIATPANTTR